MNLAIDNLAAAEHFVIGVLLIGHSESSNSTQKKKKKFQKITNLRQKCNNFRESGGLYRKISQQLSRPGMGGGKPSLAKMLR